MPAMLAHTPLLIRTKCAIEPCRAQGTGCRAQLREQNSEGQSPPTVANFRSSLEAPFRNSALRVPRLLREGGPASNAVTENAF